MKLVTYRYLGEIRLGALVGERLADLEAIYFLMKGKNLSGGFPVDMVNFLEMGEEVERLSLWMEEKSREGLVSEIRTIALKDVELLAPVPKPGKIICIGLNYLDHIKEAGRPIPKEPVFFGKFANTVIGPEGVVLLPDVSNEIDYEAELAVVIGKKAFQVDKQYALKYVAGYMNFNDISARDLQHQGQWIKGKFLDTFAPMGPWLVTQDEIKNPGDLNIQMRLNGTVMQSSNTSNMVFSVEDLVSYLSTLVTLEPGDVIATGTPHGVGFVRKPPVFIQPGDILEVEIQGLGTLRNQAKKR